MLGRVLAHVKAVLVTQHAQQDLVHGVARDADGLGHGDG